MPKTKQAIKCKKCSSINVSKRGFAKNKFQKLQKYQCKDCKSIFTLEESKGKTYPLDIILNAISTYNLGYSLEKTKERTNKKHRLNISTKSINNWVNEYKSICTFSRLRKQAIKLYQPKDTIHQQTLNHIQPYTFKFHKAKLEILTKESPQFSALKSCIEKISSNNFPHHIFIYNKDNTLNNNNQRASKIKFNHLEIKIIKKQNQSNELAKLALNLAKNNNERHSAVQNFMLINDSTTIAAEIPIYLTNWDAGYYRRLEIKDFQCHARWNQKGFIFPLNGYPTPITGHIDLLQIRNGVIHILDYKPDAEKINAAEQLTIYALALSRKLNLPLYYFKCAWFDENNYFEFYPLHAVYKKQGRMENKTNYYYPKLTRKYKNNKISQEQFQTRA